MLKEVDDVKLRDVLRRLDSPARIAIRSVLIRDQEYRDAMASRLLEHATDQAASLADLINILTLHNDARRTVVRLLENSRRSHDSRPQVLVTQT
jgi:hypothetical protein